MTLRTKKVIALLVVVAGVGVFGATLAQAIWISPQEEEASVYAPPATDALPGDLPARLRIPSLGLDAHVQHVGVGKSGNMAVPSNYHDVGWYRHGVPPGFLGSAAIDGHVDNGFGLPGVFRHLGQMKPGEEILVETADGRVLKFIVSEVAVYPADAVPLQTLFNRADKARLNLITCEGGFDAAKKTYADRLIVYAELAP